MLSQDEEWLLREKYGGEKTSEFFADCHRLAAGEPLGYVIGFVPFLDCKIWLDSHPLIPRPETELWVEKAITTIFSPRVTLGEKGEIVSVLDLCAGSGCIGVTVAKHARVARVDFAEIDPRHLPTITKNCQENLSVNCKVFQVFQSDLFESVTEKYHVILSNPPYIDPALDRTQTSVKHFEPHLALYGGREGTELIEEIIHQAPEHLNPNGQLWLEHEPEQSAFIEVTGSASGFTVATHKDQYGIDRFSILVLQ